MDEDVSAVLALRADDPSDEPAGRDGGRGLAGDGSVTDTFALLSDDTRVETVRSLAAADEPLGFAELRARVGVRDGGRFNYHLQKLRGRLVRKTDDGYVLTGEGERVADLV